ncbi:hypothetical protein [Caminibacter sp.]
MKKLLTATLFAGVLFAQNNVNIQISNETLGIYAQGKITQNNIYARGFFLYNDEDGKHNFYMAGVKAEGNLIGAELQNIKFSLIADFVHTKDNSAIPLGIGAFGYIPNLQYPVFVRGEYEFAPKILSFDDADRFSRFDAQIGIQPIENGEIFVGYRNISFNHNYKSGLYVGLGYNF